MNLKEFFRPTIIKLILFLLIPAFYAQVGVMYCFAGNCGQSSLPVPLPFAIYSYMTFTFYQQANDIFLYLVVGAIVSYLISCLIIEIYNKVKKK